MPQPSFWEWLCRETFWINSIGPPASFRLKTIFYSKERTMALHQKDHSLNVGSIQ